MVAPLHPVTSHTPPPQPPDADKENLNIPYTPVSNAHPPSAPSSSRRHSHLKTGSLSSPPPPPPAPTSKRHSHSHSLSLSLHDSPLRELTPEKLESHPHPYDGAVGRNSVMVTPPANLPPSPPLTNHDTDGEGETDTDIDADVDSDEAAHGESVETHDRERDVTEAWRDTTAQSHPLEDEGAARVDIDLEKGPEQPLPRVRSRPSVEVETDVLQLAGVTRPFEIVRRPKRTTSPKPPHSSYYMGPPMGPTAYATPPCGQIGVHHPREIVRIERDYDHGELVQFSTSYPLELQGRITPTQFLETVNALNEGLIRAHSLAGACVDNTLAVLTLWISTFFLQSTYEREMGRLQQVVDALNAELYNPQGLNILWPRKSAFLFLEIEYY
ncbi:hypothetical protein K439DRAFT_1397787 [Ramaria rubella]|nr:hypothetical protein K439DRAFT_1397787 [Ramaria rubella]